MNDMMKRVLFIEPIVAHYRRDTYRLIFSDSRFEFALLAGDSYLDIKPEKVEKTIISTYRKFTLLGEEFYYLRNSLHHVRHFNPDIVVCSGVDFHHLHTILILLWVKFHPKKKFIWWSHAGLGHQGWWGQMLRKWFYSLSDHILAYSSKGKENLRCIEIPESKVTVVRNSLNQEDYGFDVVRNLTDNESVQLLFSGRISRQRGLDVLIRAVSILSKNGYSLTCKLVGSGDDYEYRELARSLGIGSLVDFVGPLYGKANEEIFSSSGIFVFPAGIGLSVVHALSYGLPVITTNNLISHSPELELIRQGVNGDFFEDGNPYDLAAVVEKWIHKVQRYSIEIASACHNSVAELEYTPIKVSEKILKVLSSF